MESVNYDDTFCSSTGTENKRKSNADRQRAYRQRRKALAEATSTYATLRQLEAQRKRAYRERKKALAQATSTYAMFKQAEAERKRAYRQRKKAEAQATSTYVALRKSEAERKRAWRERKKVGVERQRTSELHIEEMDDSCTTSRSSTNGDTDGAVNCAHALAQLQSIGSGESHDEYIVPTSGDPSAPSASRICDTSHDSTFIVSDVRSLAGSPPVTVKLEVLEQPLDDVQTPLAASSDWTASTCSETVGTCTGEQTFLHSTQTCAVSPSTKASTVGMLPSSQTPPIQQCPRISAAVTAGSRGPALPGASESKCSRESQVLLERKTNLEIQVLQLGKRKAEAEIKRIEAEERKTVSEMLLIAEKMKRCDDEKKMLRVETEYFLQEKIKAEEEIKRNAAITEHHLEEKRKAAAGADLLIAQKRTEVIRQRMLIMELRKMRRDQKLQQRSNSIDQCSNSVQQ